MDAKQIPLRDVKSSNIAKVGYDEKNQILVVKFLNGALYSYQNVPKEIHQALITAESIGGYFTKTIRYNIVYEMAKLEDATPVPKPKAVDKTKLPSKKKE